MTRLSRPAANSHFWVPSAPLAALPKRAAARSADFTGAVSPIATWQGLQAVAVAVQSNDSLIVALTTGAVLQVSPASHAIAANYSFDSALLLSGIAASRSAAYLLLLDELYGNVFIDGVNMRSGQRVSRVTLSYPTSLGGVDATGKTALTSAGGSAAVVYDTSTGKRLSLLYDPQWNAVTVALNPANGDVWIVTASTSSVSIAVLAAGSNSTRFTVNLPSNLLDIGSLSIDPAGQSAFLLYAAVNNNQLQFIIAQFSADSGQSVGSRVLPPSAQPGRIIAAGARAGEVWWIDSGILTLSSAQGSSTIALGQYPAIASPSDVAVTAEGGVLVAENLPFRVVEFNATGGVVQSFPIVDELAICEQVPYMDIAVEASGNLLMPVCNSTILIFDRRTRAITRLYTGNGSLPRAVSEGPHGSILFTDDMDPSNLKQLARNGSIVRSWTSPLSGGQLLSAHYVNSTQEAWVVDNTASVVLQWPLFHDAPVKVWNLTAVYGRRVHPWAAVVDLVHGQLIVTAGSGDLSAAWVLWLDLSGRPQYNFSFPLSPALPFVIATGLALSPDCSRVYATDFIAGAVYVFDNEQRSRQPPAPLDALATQ